MSFRRNALCARASMAAIVVYGVLGAFLAGLLIAVDDPPTELTVFVVGMIGAFIVLSAGLAVLIREGNSELVVSGEGVELRFRVRGTKRIDWADCGTIGVYGGYYGTVGVLVFSHQRQVFRTQQECRRFAKKHDKELITALYTPELFAAVEQYAPQNLVSGCRMLMR